MHRRGLSITEVLIAIFIMAIGMISLLALFPIGILRMAESIRANRVGQAATNAQAIAELHKLWSTSDNRYIEGAIRSTRGLYIDDNDPQTPDGTYTFLPFTCPVYIDPIGSSLWPNANPYRPTPQQPTDVSGDPVGALVIPGFGVNIGIPRAYCNVTPPLSRRELLYRWFTLEDELTFLPSGLPVPPPPPIVPVERQRRISWAYLWRRPRWNDQDVVEVSVVVYSGRQLAGTPFPGGSVTQEFRCGGPPGSYANFPWNHRVFVAGNRFAALNWGSPTNAQAVRPGYWVLDATVMRISDNPYVWITNGFFYQVVNVLSEPDANGIQLIELDRPARADGYVAVFPLGVVDVFIIRE